MITLKNRSAIKACAVTVMAVASIVSLTPSAQASVFDDIHQNVSQVLIKIFSMTGLSATQKSDEKASSVKDQAPVEKKETAVGPGGAIYTISGGEGFPVFEKELTVEPAHSETGKPQTFTVWVRDPSEVAIVKAIVKTDKGEKEVVLSLNEGDMKEGRWKGSWNAESVQAGQYYKILFQAVGKSGGKAEMPFLSKAKAK